MFGGIRNKTKNTVLWVVPRNVAHKYLFKNEIGRKLDLDDPHDFNEKLQWLIIKKYGEKEGKLADKQRVKKYVEDLKIDGLFVPKTLKTYDSPEEIKLDDLPDRFVLKCNHGSGDVFVCDDKEKFDLDKAKRVLGKKLRENFAKKTLEYHYKFIKPLIMVEEYLDDGTGKNPTDYKFYVFGGKCDRVLVCSEREKELRLDDFDREWNHLDDTLPKYRSNKKIEKPKGLKEMIRIAEELCKRNNKVAIPFARVDLYDLNGKIYFGEYTFTPARGLIDYYNQKTLDELGSKLDLSWYE